MAPSTILKPAVGLVLAVVAVSLAAQASVEMPGTPVPQSLQTLAVVLVGVALGPGLGAGALVLYIVAGAVGLPVFADGAAGAEHLRGPTAGYLLGFVLGAAVCGLWPRLVTRAGDDGEGSPERPAVRREVVAVFVVALAGHVLILGLGWLRLAGMLRPALAFTSGVAPFLVGGVLKSALAAIVWGAFRLLPSRSGSATT